jgi:hypothetical protein
VNWQLLERLVVAEPAEVLIEGEHRGAAFTGDRAEQAVVQINRADLVLGHGRSQRVAVLDLQRRVFNDRGDRIGDGRAVPSVSGAWALEDLRDLEDRACQHGQTLAAIACLIDAGPGRLPLIAGTAVQRAQKHVGIENHDSWCSR